MSASSWASIAHTIAANLTAQECYEHAVPQDDCPPCFDRAAMNLYRTAVEENTTRTLTAGQWLTVAFHLAARIRLQADICDEHPRRLARYGECAFCDDTRSWRMFEKKALAEGVRLPDQDFYDALGAAPTVHIDDLIIPKEHTD